MDRVAILVETQEEQILQVQEALAPRERAHLHLMIQSPALHSQDSGTLHLGSAMHQQEIITLIASQGSTPSTPVKQAPGFLPSPRDCLGLIPSTAPKTLVELPSPGSTQLTVRETSLALRNFRGSIPSTVAKTLVVPRFQDSTPLIVQRISVAVMDTRLMMQTRLVPQVPSKSLQMKALRKGQIIGTPSSLSLLSSLFFSSLDELVVCFIKSL